ncbi:MAG: penicillin acylase family protein [Gemmatimonadetes bacterium]|nr:penicillin acylase family protein [Gemmatimonadota bacterium]
MTPPLRSLCAAASRRPRLRLGALAAAAALVAAPLPAQPAPAAEVARWQAQAARVTIHRDRHGVAHVYGTSDADAVFGMVYAQAEDDFPRVETNFINALGRMAEVTGEQDLARDLRMKLFIDTLDLQAMYRRSPAWLVTLMDAWADGLNFYLHTHPRVTPQLLTRFAPWMALAFSEGSIGGDIESVALRPLAQFYAAHGLGSAPAGDDDDAAAGDGAGWRAPEPGGSNGIAIGPARSATGHAMLLINPHTSFYFRPEIHMVSQAGLNAYGAVTWGQFFIYQGFNERVGWMHTSGGGDVIDEYREVVVTRGAARFTKHGATLRPVRVKRIGLPYRGADGTMQRKVVTAYFTHHGPVIRADGDRWVAVAMMNNPLEALQQSYLRTKATDYASFRKVMELRTNSSNNTVYADANGTIAYFHGNFVPRRNAGFDFRQPVDGSDPRTDWQGLHPIGDLVALKDPATGFLFNTNNWPWTAAGTASPREADYPRYMNEQPENARGIHALQVLVGGPTLSLEGLIATAYDSWLPVMAQVVPSLVASWDRLAAADPRKAALAAPVEALRGWDYRFGVASVPMTLGNFYAEEGGALAAGASRATRQGVYDYLATMASDSLRLAALQRAVDRITRDFGRWDTPWGEVNRFQRLSGVIGAGFDDSKPSIPVPFASATWGSLAAFGQTGARTTKRIYGNRGNSFVAAVEFGPRVRARSVLAGGVSSDPASPYFANQAERYAKADFKEVPFHRDEVERATVKQYRPGQ